MSPRLQLGHVVQGRPAATITRSPSAQPVTPAPSLAIVPDASWPCVTTGSCGREGAVDQAEVGMADPAERDLDQNLAGPGSGIGISSTAMVLESA